MPRQHYITNPVRFHEPVDGPTVDVIAREITTLASHIHAASFRLLELIRAFDQAEGWSGDGVTSCAHWLNWTCGTSLGAAREKVRVAHALADLPQISAAFSCGQISYSKVRAMTRVASPANEDYLLDIATSGTAAHVERLVKHYRRCKRQEVLETENVSHAMRELSWHEDEDGMWVINGRLSREQGALISKALDLAIHQLFEEAENEPADVTAEMPDGVDRCLPAPSPVASRRADALVRMAESFLAAPALNQCDMPSSSAERYMVHIHTDVDILSQDGATASSELDEQGLICAEASRRVACDASVVQWLDTQKGAPLSIGRRTRSVPPSIRRALIRRDWCCRFPGCTARRFVDAHHMQHWADGGETSLDNLVLLCRRHHRLVHEGGFGVARKSGQDIEFTYPDGRVCPESNQGRSRGNVEAIFESNDSIGLDINSETLIPEWGGENIDYRIALPHLLKLDEVGEPYASEQNI
jgi:hypothetical protein